jgi:hypothetical protein
MPFVDSSPSNGVIADNEREYVKRWGDDWDWRYGDVHWCVLKTKRAACARSALACPPRLWLASRATPSHSHTWSHLSRSRRSHTRPATHCRYAYESDCEDWTTYPK